jgi:hypothetical protein
VFAKALAGVLAAYPTILRFMVARLKNLPEPARVPLPSKSAAQKVDRMAVSEEVQKEQEKEDKPPLADLDKKLEEILDDKIGY